MNNAYVNTGDNTPTEPDINQLMPGKIGNNIETNSLKHLYTSGKEYEPFSVKYVYNIPQDIIGIIVEQMYLKNSSFCGNMSINL